MSAKNANQKQDSNRPEGHVEFAHLDPRTLTIEAEIATIPARIVSDDDICRSPPLPPHNCRTKGVNTKTKLLKR